MIPDKRHLEIQAGIAIAVGIIGVLVFGCVTFQIITRASQLATRNSPPMTQPQPTQPSASHPADVVAAYIDQSTRVEYRLSDHGGHVSGPGILIRWQGIAPPSAPGELPGVAQAHKAAQPIDVILATIDRVEYQQGTKELASDASARALVALYQARDALQGKPTNETDDGTPIIE